LKKRPAGQVPPNPACEVKNQKRKGTKDKEVWGRAESGVGVKRDGDCEVKMKQ